MKKIIATTILMIIASMAQANDCGTSGTITATGNRGAHFDVNGGMRHGGITMIYPTREQTIFENGAESFKPGYTVTFTAHKTDNGLCRPEGKFIVSK